MAPQASKKCGLLPPDHQQIGSCTSTGIDSEQLPGNISSNEDTVQAEAINVREGGVR